MSLSYYLTCSCVNMSTSPQCGPAPSRLHSLLVGLLFKAHERSRAAVPLPGCYAGPLSAGGLEVACSRRAATGPAARAERHGRWLFARPAATNQAFRL
jgi:hypothetical protein